MFHCKKRMENIRKLHKEQKTSSIPMIKEETLLLGYLECMKDEHVPNS